jgi:hypothetical protein
MGPDAVSDSGGPWYVQPWAIGVAWALYTYAFFSVILLGSMLMNGTLDWKLNVSTPSIVVF